MPAQSTTGAGADTTPAPMWRPRRERHPDSTYGELQDGVPPHLRPSLVGWISASLNSLAGATQRVNRMLRTQWDLPRDLNQVLADGSDSWYVDGEEILDLADALVRMHGEVAERLLDSPRSAPRAAQPHIDAMVTLKDYLAEAGSAWTVASRPGGVQLERRVDPTVAARVSGLDSTVPAEHLRRAWSHLYRRGPDPGHALGEAVLALEAAARPVVSPRDHSATLGKIIAALRAQPDKWCVELGTIDQLATRLANIWTRQPRHGTSDPAEIKHVSAEFATAAVHDALTLVHWFTSGVVRPSR